MGVAAEGTPIRARANPEAREWRSIPSNPGQSKTFSLKCQNKGSTMTNPLFTTSPHGVHV